MEMPVSSACRDAVSPARAITAPLQVDVLDQAGAIALLQDWPQGFAPAQPNPFYEPYFLAPSLAHLGDATGVQLLAVREEAQVCGIMPIQRSLNYYGKPVPHLASWCHDNAFLGAPLVREGQEHAFWQAVLAWADRHSGAALFLHLDHMPTDGPLFPALLDVAALERRAAGVVQRDTRALLASSAAPDAYFEASLSAKKRKELRRQANRLAEEGAVGFERRHDAQGLRNWIADFLALEQRGWKGAAGSAMAQEPAKAALFADALSGAAHAGKLERLSLTLDGRPIAMLANLIAAPGAFSFKTAYDERFARFSPGVLLQRENLALLARPDIAWADSCAAADHPMIERIWREKREIVRFNIAIGGRARRAAFARLLQYETRKSGTET